MAKELSLTLMEPLPVAGWEAHFASRPFYSVIEDESGEGLHAIYENPDTEVTFAFAWSKGRASFSLSRQRPRPFALEADEEVTAFNAHFRAGLAPGLVLREWDAAKVPKGKKAALPAAMVEKVWRWNRGRHDLAASLELFVPRIWVAKAGAKLQTGVDWDPEVAAALPRVDVVGVAHPKGERFAAFARLAPSLDESVRGSDVFPFLRVGEAGIPDVLQEALDALPKGKAPARVPFADVVEA